MTENPRMRVCLVCIPMIRPQDVVDNFEHSGRTVVDKLHFRRKQDARKSLENKAFF